MKIAARHRFLTGTASSGHGERGEAPLALSENALLLPAQDRGVTTDSTAQLASWLVCT
jgi:hypothetical protein